ncbi:MAG: glycogen/starch synthase [Deltaproteobacteria bacterium]
MNRKTAVRAGRKGSASTAVRTCIWMISREYEGLAGAGGVKDVCRQAAEAFARSGHKIHVVLPCYGFIDPEQKGFRRNSATFTVDMPYVGVERREQLSVWEKKSAGVKLYLLDGERFREKNNVYTYTEADEEKNPLNRRGTGHFDYFATNVLLQKGAIALIIESGGRPDIIHCHDGHTALLPAMIREIEGFRHYFHRTGCVVTIHNAGQGYHQEVGDLPFAQTISSLPQRVIFGNLLNGAFDPLMAAADYAVLNTVSENYAYELQETVQDSLTGWLGHKLLARGVRLRGITNGINPTDFDPRHPEKLLPRGSVGAAALLLCRPPHQPEGSG